MKKLIAAILIIVLVACACTAAFAEYHGVMVWDEQLHSWVIQIIDDGPGVAINPDWKGYSPDNPGICPFPIPD